MKVCMAQDMMCWVINACTTIHYTHHNHQVCYKNCYRSRLRLLIDQSPPTSCWQLQKLVLWRSKGEGGGPSTVYVCKLSINHWMLNEQWLSDKHSYVNDQLNVLNSCRTQSFTNRYHFVRNRSKHRWTTCVRYGLFKCNTHLMKCNSVIKIDSIIKYKLKKEKLSLSQ